MAETAKSTNGSDYRNWDLVAKSEYRFELEANTSLAIRLTSGSAEIYGAELAPGRLYLFGGECKAAVFTWYGCTLEMSCFGRPSTEYTSDETPMVPLINIHTAFEQMRIRAHRALAANQPETANSRPPRVLVLGPDNSGKTSACKIWCNYAIRGRGWCPTLVNLDVNDGGWTIPGTMSACPLSSAIPTCTPANPFGATATSAPTALSSSALLPVVHWFGHTDPKRNLPLIEKKVRALADSVKQKFLQDHTLNASGFIIDTPAAFSTSNAQGDNKYNLIKTCVEAFDGGVVEVDYAYHTRVVASQIRAYFYGTPLYLPPSMNPATAQLGGEAITETTLSPFSVTLNAGDLQIYRIGSKMIDTVLEYEPHLFSSSEITILNGIKRANYLQQYLISRIVQRKRGKWLRFDQLNESYAPEFRKHAAEADVPKRMANTLLELSGHLRLEEHSSTLSIEKDIIDLTLDSDDEDACAPKHDISVSSMRNGDAAAPTASPDSVSEPVIFLEDTGVATPAQLLECLNLEELKRLGKRLKFPSISKLTREELVNAILRSTSTQTTLSFAIVSKTSKLSSKKDGNDWGKLFPFKPPQVPGKTQNMPLQERRIRDMCSELYGACFRLMDGVVQALHLVSVVYFRSTEQSEANSIMLSAILSFSGKRNYPAYEYKRTTDVFPTRTDLLRYMEISLLLNEVENLLAGAGQPQGVKFDRLKASQDAINIWETHWDRWNLLVAYLKDKSHRERGLERFEEGYLLTRLAYKAAECFGTLKKYDLEAKLLVALLRQTRWRRTKRGRWYDRLALIYTRYMGGGDANLRQAREYLLTGLKDDLVSLGSRPMLLRRLLRLEKQLRLPLDEQYVGEGDLKVAVETRIEGTRTYTPQTSTMPPKGVGVASKVTPSTMDKVILIQPSGSPSSSLPPGNGNHRPKWIGKTMWAGEEGEVNVETFALQYYARLGFKGFHSEGTIVLTLFGLLFWDILFAPIPGAFETPYQSAPLDLAHDSFFGSREEIINARLDELRNTPGAAHQIATSVYSREREREPWCVGMRWDLFEHEDELVEIVECLGGPALAAICRLLAEEYGSRGGGVPDLFIWNATQNTCKFVEVKGPGDNLSETQKVWIDVLLGAGVDVEVCRVYEHGEMPARTAKGKDQNKKELQRRSTSRKRTPKVYKDVPEDKAHTSDPEPEEEEDELQSSSEDEADAVEAIILQELRKPQCTTKTTAPVVIPTSPGIRNPLETNLAKESIKFTPDAGSNQRQSNDIKGEHTSKSAAAPPRDLPEAGSSDPAPIPGTNRAYQTLLRPITSLPAPVLPTHSNKLTLESVDSVISVITGGISAIQETVITETPQATQYQPSAGCSKPTLAENSPPIQIPEIYLEPHPKAISDSKPVLQLVARSNASPQKSNLPSNKEWRDMLKTIPAKRMPKGEIFASPAKRSSPVIEPTPKRKHRDSTAHTPARRSASASAVTGIPKRAADDNTEVVTRNLRKRRRTTSEQVGVSGSPAEWEKKWPDVFPEWIGNLSESSDTDYKPSQ
ncbi:unnamed protein product [Rhizoctonia solani]|uniref:Fanconi-associated nuclease n=1 Tax=Rhizoctonia solani TaxID=456999 RepID=A0A8H3CXJ8_9AGAM|nr:unnamed protein product [Rhizoctonia solani]